VIELRITRDEVTPELRDLYDRTNPATIVRLAGKSVERGLRTHFLDRNSEPNSRGWKSSGIWRDISDQTAMGQISAGTGFAFVFISISHPAILSKVYGAEITPKRGRYLAIPATARAAAAGSPREGGAPPDLKVERAPVPPEGRWPGDPSKPGSMRLALVQPATTVKEKIVRRKKTALGFAAELRDVANKSAGVWYWLILSARVRKDPRALPPDQRLSDDAMAAINDYLARQDRRMAS
jgi:hypothetical protein